MVLQFTGLSGAGKTTLATLLCSSLEQKGIETKLIDGDQYRKTISRDLGFTVNDRKENIRRLAKVAGAFSKKENIVIIAAINPFEDLRAEMEQNLHAKTIWIKCPLDELIKRDTKGLYRKAMLPNGHPQKIQNFTGVNQAYESPVCAHLVIDTSLETVEVSAKKLLGYVLDLLQATT